MPKKIKIYSLMDEKTTIVEEICPDKKPKRVFDYESNTYIEVTGIINTSKSINNSFNRGDYDIEYLPEIKLDNSTVISDNYTDYKTNELNGIIYTYWETNLKTKFKNRRIPKKYFVEIYEDILNITQTDFTKIEVFVFLSEFLSSDMRQFYLLLSPVQKEELIVELDKKMNIFARKKISKLF